MAGQKELEQTCTDPACLHDKAPEYPPGPRRTWKIYQYPVIGGLLRFFSWWLVFFGIYASSSVCPFCGTPGCPVGSGTAALVGGVFAGFWQYGKSAWEKLRGFVPKSS